MKKKQPKKPTLIQNPNLNYEVQMRLDRKSELGFDEDWIEEIKDSEYEQKVLDGSNGKIDSDQSRRT
jgi:hypothetical protein